MAGPRTFGGWVVVNHGSTAWFHVCRLMCSIGLAWELDRKRPTFLRAADFSSSRASHYRDKKVFERVFPDVDPVDMYERIKWSTKRAAAADRVMRAPSSVAVAW